MDRHEASEGADQPDPSAEPGIVAYAERALLALAEARRDAAANAFRRAVDAHRATVAGSEAADEAARELVDTAAAHLRSSGVEVVVKDDPPRVIVTPGRAAPLNDLARELRDELDTTLAYTPERLFTPANHQNDEMTIVFKARYDSDKVTIDAPHRAIAELDAHDKSLRHEIIHADTHAALRRGRSSPYHADLRGSVAVNVCGLSLSMGITGVDELRAYGHDIERAAHRLAEALAREENADEILSSSYFDESYCSSRFVELEGDEGASEIARLWGLIARSLLPALLHQDAFDGALDDFEAAAQRAETFASGDDGTWIWLSPEDGAWPRLELKLAASQGSDDPSNRDLLKTQYAWTRATVEAHLQQLRAIEDVFEEMRSAEPREREELLCALPALTRRIDPERETHPDVAGPPAAAAGRVAAFRAARAGCARDPEA